MPARYDATSRYELGSSGQEANRKSTTSRQYTLYTVRQNDTLESIAFRHLGDSRRYWEIADMNPQVLFPLAIDTGTVIRLPV